LHSLHSQTPISPTPCPLLAPRPLISSFSFFFFTDPATPEIYTLSLHDALPIFDAISALARRHRDRLRGRRCSLCPLGRDIEAVEARDYRPPLRERTIGVDEKRQRALHAGERGRGLHQSAELNRSGKIGGTDHDEGEDDRYLRVA